MKSLDVKEAFLLTCIEEFKRINMAQTMALETYISTGKEIENKALLDLTLESTIKLNRIMDSVLFIASPAFSRTKPALENFNITDLIDVSAKEMSDIVEFNNFKILKKYNTDTNIIASKEKIKEVIDSILTITLDKANNGTNIIIEACEKNDYFMLEVKSTSSSIEYDYLKDFLVKKDKAKSFDFEKLNFLSGVNILVIREMLIAHKAKLIFRLEENDVKVLGFAISLNR